MSEESSTKVVGVRTMKCLGNPEGNHVLQVKLENEDVLDFEDIISLMDAGRSYFMIPPEGAPAHIAYSATGLPLIFQIRNCPDCKERVLFA